MDDILDKLPDVLTVDDIATFLRIDVSQVHVQMQRYRDILQPYKVGRSLRIFKTNFELYLHSRQTARQDEPTE